MFNSPSHNAFFSELNMRHNDEDSVKPILKKKSSSEDGLDEARNHQQQLIVKTPQPILKKKSNSSENKSQIHPILKNNKSREGSLDRLNNSSMPSLIVHPPVQQPVHSILKKSSSEEKPHSEHYHVKPILKKSSFDECHSEKNHTIEVKPILKRNRSESRSESECSTSSISCSGGKASIKPLVGDRVGSSHEMNTVCVSPELPKVITQEDIEADLKRDAITNTSSTGPFVVGASAAASASISSLRLNAPRRKSHPSSSTEDTRNLVHHNQQQQYGDASVHRESQLCLKGHSNSFTNAGQFIHHDQHQQQNNNNNNNSNKPLAPSYFVDQFRRKLNLNSDGTAKSRLDSNHSNDDNSNVEQETKSNS